MKNIQKDMLLNLQMFAENDETGEPTTESEVKEIPTKEPEKVEKTYTRDEVEKIKAHERETMRREILTELTQKQEAEKAEAERLAKMDEDQKKSYKLEQTEKERDSAVSELNAYKLKDESIKQAREKGVSLSLMETLDYSKETAESIQKKIEIFAQTAREIHENAIKEYSKEPTPQTGERINHDSDKTGYEKFAEKYNK